MFRLCQLLAVLAGECGFTVQCSELLFGFFHERLRIPVQHAVPTQADLVCNSFLSQPVVQFRRTKCRIHTDFDTKPAPLCSQFPNHHLQLGEDGSCFRLITSSQNCCHQPVSAEYLERKVHRMTVLSTAIDRAFLRSMSLNHGSIRIQYYFFWALLLFCDVVIGEEFSPHLGVSPV